MKLGLKIKKIRELRNLTQEYVAYQLGISQSSYCRIEKGKTKLGYERINKIAGIFGIDPQILINFEESAFFNIPIQSEMIQPEFEKALGNNYSDFERRYFENLIKHVEEEVNFMRNVLNRLL